MNLFKNSVGRPSNEIKRKRRVIIYSLIVFFILLFFIFIISYKNKNNNKAGLGYIYPYISISDNKTDNLAFKNSNIDLEFKTKYYNKKEYYFKLTYHSDNKNEEGKCAKLSTGNKKAKYSLPIYYDNTYISLTLYTDSNCSNEYKTYKSKTYTLATQTTTTTTTKKQNTTKTFTATFHKNGATKIGADKLSCTTKSSSCTIKAPSITRSGYNINGWATSIIFVAKYKVGDTITLTKDTNFYAKTSKKENKVQTTTASKKSISMSKFVEHWKIGTMGIINVKTTPEKDKVTLKSSNSKIMKVEKIDNNSWRMTAVSEGSATITATSSSNATVSYNYIVDPYVYIEQTYKKEGTKRIKNGVKSTEVIDDVTIYIEKGVKKDIYNNFISDFKEIPKYMKYGVKEIYILTKKTFENNNDNVEAYVGRTWPKDGSTFIDIKAEAYTKGRMTTMIHELAHTMDYRYNLKYGKDNLSNNKEWNNLYKKYKKEQKNALEPYAYTNNLEFLATSFEFYYLENISKRHKLSDSNLKNYKFPDDIKNQIKETIEIFKKIK